jgi:hypothetical protein
MVTMGRDREAEVGDTWSHPFLLHFLGDEQVPVPTVGDREQHVDAGEFAAHLLRPENEMSLFLVFGSVESHLPKNFLSRASS